MNKNFKGLTTENMTVIKTIYTKRGVITETEQQLLEEERVKIIELAG